MVDPGVLAMVDPGVLAFVNVPVRKTRASMVDGMG